MRVEKGDFVKFKRETSEDRDIGLVKGVVLRDDEDSSVIVESDGKKYEEVEASNIVECLGDVKQSGSIVLDEED